MLSFKPIHKPTSHTNDGVKTDPMLFYQIKNTLQYQTLYMTNIIWPGSNNWSLLQKIILRFIFIYFTLYIAPWTWIEYIPYVGSIVKYHF